MTKNEWIRNYISENLCDMDEAEDAYSDMMEEAYEKSLIENYKREAENICIEMGDFENGLDVVTCKTQQAAEALAAYMDEILDVEPIPAKAGTWYWNETEEEWTDELPEEESEMEDYIDYCFNHCKDF